MLNFIYTTPHKVYTLYGKTIEQEPTQLLQNAKPKLAQTMSLVRKTTVKVSTWGNAPNFYHLFQFSLETELSSFE